MPAVGLLQDNSLRTADLVHKPRHGASPLKGRTQPCVLDNSLRTVDIDRCRPIDPHLRQRAGQSARDNSLRTMDIQGAAVRPQTVSAAALRRSRAAADMASPSGAGSILEVIGTSAPAHASVAGAAGRPSHSASRQPHARAPPPESEPPPPPAAASAGGTAQQPQGVHLLDLGVSDGSGCRSWFDACSCFSGSSL